MNGWASPIFVKELKGLLIADLACLLSARGIWNCERQKQLGGVYRAKTNLAVRFHFLYLSSALFQEGRVLPREGGFLRFNFEDGMLPLSPSFGLTHIVQSDYTGGNIQMGEDSWRQVLQMINIFVTVGCPEQRKGLPGCLSTSSYYTQDKRFGYMLSQEKRYANSSQSPPPDNICLGASFTILPLVFANCSETAIDCTVYSFSLITVLLLVQFLRWFLSWC